ncbi:hypothetical protein AUI07_04645 [archaeon 13_2_20CM_2_53_6]|nr:MAG: hypothetical protein AUI07_04645 [archaeon 13_2_20CM_2_53_6]
MRSYQFKNKTKSVTRTVRIDEDIDYQLEKLAHEQRVSVNYFANQALRKFVEWDVFADRLGFVTLPSDIFEKLVGFVTDEQAKELGGWFGKNLAKDLIAFLFKRVDLETSVRALELLGPRYGKAFRFEYTNDGHLTTVILNHGFGRKASLFYGEAVKALLKDLVNTTVDIGLSEHQVFAQIVGPNEFRITMAPANAPSIAPVHPLQKP